MNIKNKRFDIRKFLKDRPLSWSAISSFEYDPEQWYRNYYLGQKDPANKEMIFGSRFATAAENGKPMAKITMLCKMEQEFNVVFNKIPLKGFADTFCTKTKKRTGEYKTGKYKSNGDPAWTQKRVDEHGQITLYALMNYVKHKMRPEDCEFFLEWIPTAEDGSFNIYIIDPNDVKHFVTKRTMKDLLDFGMRINRTVDAMQAYVRNHE